MKDKHLTINISAKTIFMAFAVVVGSLLIIRLSDIVLLVFVSLILAAAIHPTVRTLQERLRVPKPIAISLLYLLILAVIALVVISVVPAVSSQISSLSSNLPEIRDSISQSFSNPAARSFIENALGKLSQSSSDIVPQVASATLGVLVSIFGIVTVMILSAYFVSGGKQMIEQALEILPDKSWEKRILDIIARISRKLGYWLRGQLVVSFIMFLFVYIGLSLLGVDYALTIALLAGLLESIPTFGAFISATIGILMALTISPSKAIAVAILYLVVNQVQGNIITPQIMKRALGVPAVLVIISLLVFGRLFGLVGVLLAAPMAAITVLLIEEFAPETKRLIERAAKNDRQL